LSSKKLTLDDKNSVREAVLQAALSITLLAAHPSKLDALKDPRHALALGAPVAVGAHHRLALTLALCKNPIERLKYRPDSLEQIADRHLLELNNTDIDHGSTRLPGRRGAQAHVRNLVATALYPKDTWIDTPERQALLEAKVKQQADKGNPLICFLGGTAPTQDQDLLAYVQSKLHMIAAYITAENLLFEIDDADAVVWLCSVYEALEPFNHSAKKN
jgi:hypothetical protein